MDRKTFFDTLKTGLFQGMVQSQVDGIDGILDEAEKRKTTRNRLAYVLATSHHETARTMQPITEYGGKSYFDKYNAGTRIGKMLGNTQPGDGYKFRGRGFVQLTGRRNYTHASGKLGVDFVGSPDLVMLLQNAIPILFDGMEEGWFTGKSLSMLIDDKDESDAEDLAEFRKARMIINGTDKADAIAKIALQYEHALEKAGYA